MKEKLTIGAICALSILAVGLLFAIKQIPDVSRPLRNEISLLSNQNRHEYVKLKADWLRFHENCFYRCPDLLEECEKAFAMLDSLSFQFDRSITTGSSFGLEQLIIRANTVIDSSFFQEEEPLSFANAQVLVSQVQKQANDQLRILMLEHARFEVHSVMADYLTKLNEMTQAANIEVDQDFPQRPASWKKGKISVRVPAVMELEDTYRVEIRISKELEAQILQEFTPSEKIVIDSLWVGDIMVMRLQGEHFSIVGFDEEEQGVLDGDYTQWEYEVTPLETGRHKLLVKAGIVYYVPNLGPTRKYFPVYEVEIDIEVNPVKRLASFATQRWEFIVSTILIPLITLLYGRIQKRRNSRHSSESVSNDSKDKDDS